MHPDFPLPDVDWAPTRELWAGAARGVLRIPRCDQCRRWMWYPEPPCRWCGGAALTWYDTSGRGRLFSWTVVRHAWIPQVADRLPFVTGLVALEEDAAVRVATYIVDCAPASLRCEQPVHAVFRPLRYAGVERTVMAPLFTPTI
jgi:uncharacterized OB-fold protein